RVRSQFVPAVRKGGAGLGGPQRLESRGNRLGERRTESGGGAGGRLGRCGGADVSRQRFSAAPKSAAVRGRRGCWRKGRWRSGTGRRLVLQPSASRKGGCAGKCGKIRSEEHTSELQSRENLVCRLLLEKKKKTRN